MARKEKDITVYDVYTKLKMNTEVKIIDVKTMEELTIAEAKDRKLGLIVPIGENKINILC